MGSSEKTLISWGDILDVYHKIKQKGVRKFISVFNITSDKRVVGKWDNYQSSSDFWVIPQLKSYWNQKISGNPEQEYEDYVAEKYFENQSGLKLLSIGCGHGAHERAFAKYNCFSEIVGIDLSEKRIESARKTAQAEKCNITYHAGDFKQLNFKNNYFDVVLFSSSLHHFKDIDGFLKQQVRPLLKTSGYLVVYEFCGPNRLQWTKEQLNKANQLLQETPKKYKLLTDGKTIKKKVYRPGLIRMLLVDPSEAPDSENLRQAVHNNFSVIEETWLGWNILHILLKGIAHNFLNTDVETTNLLNYLIKKEETFIKQIGKTDSVFGVYQKEA